jgi:hypothetical protein
MLSLDDGPSVPSGRWRHSLDDGEAPEPSDLWREVNPHVMRHGHFVTLPPRDLYLCQRRANNRTLYTERAVASSSLDAGCAPQPNQVRGLPPIPPPNHSLSLATCFQWTHPGCLAAGGVVPSRGGGAARRLAGDSTHEPALQEEHLLDESWPQRYPHVASWLLPRPEAVQPLHSLFPDRALAPSAKGARRYQPLPQPYTAASFPDREGRTALHWASHRGDVAGAQLAIEAGSGVNAIDQRGWTALDCAAANGQQDVMQLLLSSGALTSVITQDGHQAVGARVLSTCRC